MESRNTNKNWNSVRLLVSLTGNLSRSRSYDLKRAVRSFVIHFRYQEKSHTKDTTTAQYRTSVILSRGSWDMVGGIAARCEPKGRGVLIPMWARFPVLIHIGLTHNGYRE